MTTSMIVTIVAGLAILFLGRQLFWLFVAVAGFAAGFQLATNLFTNQPEGVILLIALLVGLIGALVAVFLRYVAVAVAGFSAGAYLGTLLLPWLDTDSTWMFWLLFIVGGIIGAILLVMLFDWALIGLSAVTGAAMLVPFTDLSPTLQLLLFVILILAGVAVQFYFLPHEERVVQTAPPPRTEHSA